MDNRKYEALIWIAKTGSITQTAEQMGYTQSGITQMISSLERELGIRLLTRTNKGATLTEAGRRLLPLMQEENHWENHIRQEASRMLGMETGTITVGCLSSISAAWMPTILENFALDYPNIHIHMRENEAPELERLLMEGQIDAAIAEIQDSKSLNVTPLLDDEILAVLPTKHPLSARESVSLEELTEYPFISYSTGGSSDQYRGWPEHTLGSRIRLDARYSCTSDFSAIQMVSHNLGVTVASRLMLNNYPTVTTNIPLFPALQRSIGIGVRAGQPALPAARSFINYVVQIVNTIVKNA